MICPGFDQLLGFFCDTSNCVLPHETGIQTSGEVLDWNQSSVLTQLLGVLLLLFVALFVPNFFL